MIVLSVNVKTKNGVLFSIPRNMWGVPLPPAAASRFGDTYDNLLNSLYPFALAHPEAFRGGRDPGATALKQVIANLLGIRIDYYALVDFAGFVDVIDALGGVDMNIPKAVLDRVSPATPGGEWIRIDLKPGFQHLTAQQTFAYVRARSQTSDYARIGRQRCVLAAIADRANARTLLRNFRRLAATMRRSVGTDISLQSLPDIIELTAKMNTRRLVSIGFVAADLHARGQPPGHPAHPRHRQERHRASAGGGHRRHVLRRRLRLAGPRRPLPAHAGGGFGRFLRLCVSLLAVPG